MDEGKSFFVLLNTDIQEVSGILIKGWAELQQSNTVVTMLIT
jgi:hypothetical protein